MEKNRTTKIIAIVALCLAVLGTTIAFAAMSTTLTINGDAEMQTAKWKIYFTNLTGPNIAGDAAVLTEPTLTDTHFGNYSVKLTKPGDSISYSFDVYNEGDMAADLGTFTKNAPTITSPTGVDNDVAIVTRNLVYTFTYTGGAAVAQNDTLAAGETKNLTLTIAYPQSVTELPSDDVTIADLDITMIYNQQ